MCMQNPSPALFCCLAMAFLLSLLSVLLLLYRRDGTAKIADVGMAKILARDYVTGVVGTLAWCALPLPPPLPPPPLPPLPLLA